MYKRIHCRVIPIASEFFHILTFSASITRKMASSLVLDAAKVIVVGKGKLLISQVDILILK